LPAVFEGGVYASKTGAFEGVSVFHAFYHRQKGAAWVARARNADVRA
jgi:hypothetical protein